MNGQGPVRFGLIGFGAWGRHHANAIAACPEADLVAIAAPSEDSRQAAKQDFPSADVFEDFHRLLDESNVDCVDIVVPSHLHFEIASAALRSGRHVLLEKPMCVRLEDCDALIELAREHSLHLVVGHELRLSSMWGLVKEKVDAGFIGDPLYALVELSRNPYRLGSGGWRYDINRVGNWILEEPIHFFDLARWYMAACGDPCEVYATARAKRPEHPELQDNFSAILKFPNQSYAVVTQTLCAFEHHQTVKLTGTEGALWASWSGAMDRTRHPTFSLRAFDGQRVEAVPIEKMTGELFELEDQIRVMCEVVRGRRQPHCTAEDGRWSVAMCLAAQRSVDSGQPVSI
ncbi:MAG: gfo/Idh/MocA family oxidoreductase [Planctomycetota bacterium]|nr:MAG: gfo/Idh/MocA family oxidoreductase [Planctomycetota bacterium]